MSASRLAIRTALWAVTGMAISAPSANAAAAKWRRRGGGAMGFSADIAMEWHASGIATPHLTPRSHARSRTNAATMAKRGQKFLVVSCLRSPPAGGAAAGEFENDRPRRRLQGRAPHMA